MRIGFSIIIVLIMAISCDKARRCECRHETKDTVTKVFFINGTKSASGKACKNMADSIETCTLKN